MDSAIYRTPGAILERLIGSKKVKSVIPDPWDILIYLQVSLTRLERDLPDMEESKYQINRGILFFGRVVDSVGTPIILYVENCNGRTLFYASQDEYGWRVHTCHPGPWRFLIEKMYDKIKTSIHNIEAWEAEPPSLGTVYQRHQHPQGV